MAKLRHNVVANFIGQGWLALVAVLFAPVYIRMLGMEAYALIGIYLSMQALLFVLDLGLSATLTRELARHAAASHDTRSAHDVFHTIERLFLPLCAIITTIAVFASDAIASKWLQPVALDHSQVVTAMTLIGLAIAAQWPSAFYAGGLVGLERQVKLNAASIIFATLRWAAVVPIMWLTKPSIEVFLTWQIVVSVLQSLLMRRLLLQALPGHNRKPRFDRDFLRSMRGFTLGLFGIAFVSFVLVQIDRIVLSHVLPLDKFGHYVLAATAAGLLSRSVYPFFTALYPRYSRLVASGDRAKLSRLYRVSNSLMASLGGALAAMTCVFSYDILRLWTSNPILATETAPVLSLLAAGMLLSGLMSLLYALQLAHGWIRPTLWLNTIYAIAMVPATFWMAQRHGMVGAASCWLGVNLFSFVFVVPLLHHRLMPTATYCWYWDVLPPVVAAFLVALVARVLITVPTTMVAAILCLACVSALSLAVSVFASLATQRLSLSNVFRTIDG